MLVDLRNHMPGLKELRMYDGTDWGSLSTWGSLTEGSDLREHKLKEHLL